MPIGRREVGGLIPLPDLLWYQLSSRRALKVQEAKLAAIECVLFEQRAPRPALYAPNQAPVSSPKMWTKYGDQ